MLDQENSEPVVSSEERRARLAVLVQELEGEQPIICPRTGDVHPTWKGADEVARRTVAILEDAGLFMGPATRLKRASREDMARE